MSKKMSATPSANTAVAKAVRHKLDKNLLLRGDAIEKEAQQKFLIKEGFDVMLSLDGNPGLGTEEEFKKALEALWLDRISGWHHYRGPLIQYEICTRADFNLKCELTFRTRSAFGLMPTTS